MADVFEFKYGDYEIRPRPLLTISKQHIKTPAGTGLGTLYNISLQGTIIPTGDKGVPLNAPGDPTINQVFSGITSLRKAFDTDGKLLHIRCTGSEQPPNPPLVSGHPRITSMSIEDGIQNNYVQTASYTIELEMESLTGTGETINNAQLPAFINDFSESWSVDMRDERVPTLNFTHDSATEDFPFLLNVSHELSAVGVASYTGVDGSQNPILMKEAWQQARDYLMTKTGFDARFVALSGLYNFNPDQFVSKNNFRTVSVDKTQGSVNISETFVVLNSGTNYIGNAEEDFTIDVATSVTDPITSVTINGTVQGLAEIDYGTSTGEGDGFTVLTSKYESASGYWDVVRYRLYGRAKAVYDNLFDSYTGYACWNNRTLHIDPISISNGINIVNGTISYNYTYNNRPLNFFTGALSESIVVNDNKPADLFASLTILGRTSGPLLQDVNTKGPASTRQLDIEVITCPPTGTGSVSEFFSTNPSGDANRLVALFEDDLTGGYSQVFKSSDSESWDIKLGRYSRNVAWTYGSC